MKRKVLYFDIETSPNVVLSWNIGYKVALNYENIIAERQIICICWKWAGEKTVHSVDWGVNKQCDKALLKKFSKVLSKADIVIGHNSDKYDSRFVNARMIYHGLKPVGEYTTLDTLKKSRQTFMFNSHRLDYIGQHLGLGEKLDTGGFSLWKEIFLNKNSKSLAKMIRYCKQDVNLLEKVHLKLSPYVKHTVHTGAMEGNGALSCPSCASTRATWYGTRVKTKIRYRRRQCSECHHTWITSVRV